MADDFDVEAMLEAPYKKEDRENGHTTSSTSSSRRDRDKDKDRRRRSSSRGRESKHSSSSSSKYDRSEKRRSRERDSQRSSHRDRRPSDRSSRHSGGGGGRRRSRSRSPGRLPHVEMSPEERDARTVFCMQLSQRIRPRDLQEFFSSVGKVKDVRLITDNKTRRSKGIAYIEFALVESVALALGLHGQRLLGVPIIVQVSQAEKNRMAGSSLMLQRSITGPMRLYVGSLHFNITEDMLRGIFEPFGKIQDISLIKSHETTRSQGYGFITFNNADEAKKALEQLNGFELAGRPMKVGNVTERTGIDGASGQGGMLDSDDMDRAGIDLGATGRLQLMAKLAEGTTFEIPPVAANALNIGNAQSQQLATQLQQVAPPIATQCFMLSNMFDPLTETALTWDVEIRDDVIEECNNHGGVLHLYVDKASAQGNVYVKCPSVSAAVASVNALHGRYFAGKVITAAYVPLPNYHSLFPDSARAVQLLMTSSQTLSASMGIPMPVPYPTL